MLELDALRPADLPMLNPIPTLLYKNKLRLHKNFTAPRTKDIINHDSAMTKEKSKNKDCVCHVSEVREYEVILALPSELALSWKLCLIVYNISLVFRM